MKYRESGSAGSSSSDSNAFGLTDDEGQVNRLADDNNYLRQQVSELNINGQIHRLTNGLYVDKPRSIVWLIEVILLYVTDTKYI